jgi:hypothetical protein
LKRKRRVNKSLTQKNSRYSRSLTDKKSMSRFSLPSRSSKLLNSLRFQLRSQSMLYRLLQIIIGAILPLGEGIIVNRATDPSNAAASEFWILIWVVAIIHIFLLILLVKTEMPLSSFLIEFDEQAQDIELMKLKSQKLEAFAETLQAALAASELSLIGLEISFNSKHPDIADLFKVILNPWIQNRASIFWPQGGNTLYNIAVYLYDSGTNQLNPAFRSCDDRIKRHDRSWNSGVGHVGVCHTRRETSFCNDMESAISLTNDESSLPEDNIYYKSVIAEPIRVNNDVVGVLVITSNNKDQFIEEIHVPCMRNLTQLLGLGWEVYHKGK